MTLDQPHQSVSQSVSHRNARKITISVRIQSEEQAQKNLSLVSYLPTIQMNILSRCRDYDLELRLSEETRKRERFSHASY